MSWKKNEAIKIKTTEIKLVSETILVINKIGKKIIAQIKKKNGHYIRVRIQQK